MQLFRKNREIRISPKYYLLLQDKWAKKMSVLTSDLSKQSLVFYLILFILITGGISLYNVYSGFSSKEYKQTGIGIRINFKSLIVPKPSLNRANETLLPKEKFENITSFSIYLDSLKESEGGRKIYDSIKNYRPGLLDSLIFIENYYKMN
ncbi:hypothetical protein SAMN05444671_4353 [Flavobacterium sp. CF108]|uniref:hypothetical protein n=1 Tax=Flavobacterium sp. CF108 TaxID=1882758 RepID=UPI00091DF4BD|nr:hypothetical protein [Flavobacterium sp. CF108]SHH93245.1 hypothetical protein SAMN05444671_4353 [Flavobacterium sp. CF108]